MKLLLQPVLAAPSAKMSISFFRDPSSQDSFLDIIVIGILFHSNNICVLYDYLWDIFSDGFCPSRSGCRYDCITLLAEIQVFEFDFQIGGTGHYGKNPTLMDLGGNSVRIVEKEK